MRKFSWILALILALSMAFVGCSSGGGDGDGGGGGGGGGDATVTLPEGSITDITVDPALTGYWDGDEDNGTLVFTTSGVGTEDELTTNAGAFFFAVKSAVVETVSTVEITGGKVKIKVILTGGEEEMFNYAIADNVLTIKEDDDVKFVGTLRSSSGGGGGGGSGDAWNLDALKALAGGITLSVGGDSAPSYDATTKVVTVEANASSMFYFSFPETLTVAVGDKVKVTYACIVDAGAAEVSIKAGANSWSPDLDYPTLSAGKSQTFTVTMSKIKDDEEQVTSGKLNGLTIQHNHKTSNANAKYYVKVLSVEKVD